MSANRNAKRCHDCGRQRKLEPDRDLERQQTPQGSQMQQGQYQRQPMGGADFEPVGQKHPAGIMRRSGPPEDQRAVGAAKSEIVLQGDLDLELTRRVGAIVEIAFRVLIEDIDGWRRYLVMYSQHRQR